MTKPLAIGMAALWMVALASVPRAQQPGAPQVVPIALYPTNHPKVPRDLSQLWLAPEGGRLAGVPAPLLDLSTAIRMESNGELTRALALLSQPAVEQGSLGIYAAYYAAEASLKLGRVDDAQRAFEALEGRQPIGYLAFASAIGRAEAEEAQHDYSAAVDIYEHLLAANLGAPDDLLMRIGKAAKAGGDPTKAAAAFARVYYEFALSELAPTAGFEVLHSPALEPLAFGNGRYTRELRRAERLFDAKQYVPAHAAFDLLRAAAQGDDSELVRLRIAECDYFQKHARAAREEIRPYIEHASRQGEALYFYAVASLDLMDRSEYLKTARRVVDEFPAETWSEDALDSLASFSIQQNDDAKADALFSEMYGRFPTGNHAERAAWRIGWRAYREGRYGDTVHVFEQAAHDFPRSDFRPPWLYWSGRAYEQLHEPGLAEARYKLTTADYFNTYHGRLAADRLKGWSPAPRVILTSADTSQRDDGGTLPTTLPPLPPNGQTIRLLLSVGLFDDALNELQFASRAWGDSSQIQATTAWIQRQQGRSETGSAQFNFFRGSMTTMKRAYPQYLAAGGELLPRDVLVVIFPVAYWDTIQKYSAESHLDPYLVAALTAQESTFVRDIKSYAGAVGLMQFMPPDGREWARKVSLPYSTTLLTNADASIKMGTAYLADLARRFDNQMYLALAAYNAGPGRAHHWVDERPGLSQEEFIDDIPYPQTQNYVKKILATAQDYRRLYGPGAPAGDEPDLDAKLTAVKKTVPAPAKAVTKPAAAKPAAPRPAPAPAKPGPAPRVPAATRK